MKKAKKFNIQIPTQIVRSNKFTSGDFILLAKIMQAYYSQSADDKPLTFSIDHKLFMHLLFFKDNATFKKNLKGLVEKKVVQCEYESLPRRGGLELTLNKLVIPEFNKERGYFTQLPYTLLNREVIQAVGHVGVRLMYYYKSYINAKNPLKQFCFVAEETAADHLGITAKTVIKYNTLLKKRKFVKIEKHELHKTDDYDDDVKLVFKKYNNHYTLRLDKVEEFCEESRTKLA